MLDIPFCIYFFISVGLIMFFVLQTNLTDFWAVFLAQSSMFEGNLTFFLWLNFVFVQVKIILRLLQNSRSKSNIFSLCLTTCLLVASVSVVFVSFAYSAKEELLSALKTGYMLLTGLIMLPLMTYLAL